MHSFILPWMLFRAVLNTKCCYFFNFVLIFPLAIDLELGQQPPHISQLLQDEDVCDCGSHPHELWRHPQHLQLHASSTPSHPEEPSTLLVSEGSFEWSLLRGLPTPTGTLGRSTACIWSSSRSCSFCCVSLATSSSWFSTSGSSSLPGTPSMLPVCSSTSSTCSSCRETPCSLFTRDRWVANGKKLTVHGSAAECRHATGAFQKREMTALWRNMRLFYFSALSVHCDCIKRRR